MYERSAIVLERYFENLLGFNQTNNLKQNFKNYCDLFEKFIIFQEANTAEFEALAEFQEAEGEIENIQTQEEKLYKKNAKLEYNRDLIFSDISQKPEEIERCSIKIESDIAKNQNNLVSLREKFVEAVKVYNEKKSQLAKCKKNRKAAETEYNISFENLQNSVENIAEEYIEMAKVFANEENEEALISTMSSNGKDEKIPFNNSVLTCAVKLGFAMFKIEADDYLEAYKMSKKLITELLEGAVSVESHQKVIRNINVKLNFLNAEKEYLVQFLDYERITVIYGKRTHRTLMMEACEKFDLDTAQINNLFTLLLKEIANKSTKKAYKELYNKSYLIDMEEKEAKFKKEKNKMNLPVGTIMNSNYWRIEGIKNLYTVFYKDVSEIFGKDLDEFEIPKEPEIIEEPAAEPEIQVVEVVEKPEENIEVIEAAEEQPIEAILAIESEIVNTQKIEETEKDKKSTKVAKLSKIKRYTRKIVVEEPIKEEIAEVIEEPKEIENVVAFEEIKEEKKSKKTKKEKKAKTSKKSKKETIEIIEIAEEPVKEEIAEIIEEQKEEVAKEEIIETAQFAEVLTENDEEDIFTEKYKDIERQLAEIDRLDDLEDIEEIFDMKELVEEQPYENEEIDFYDEESIFENIENYEYEELSLKKNSKNKNKSEKKGIFNKIIKINSKAKKQVNN